MLASRPRGTLYIGVTGDFYEGAAVKRIRGEDAEMTTDSVFAIFSTTKAIAGTVALQLVEDGRLDLDAPAKIFMPRKWQSAGSGRFRQSWAAQAQARPHHPDAAAHRG